MSNYSDRIFQGRSTFPGLEEWFYRTREGIAGPYFNRDDAAVALRCFVKYCQDNGLTGGRDRARQSDWEGGWGLPGDRFGPLERLAWAALWAVSGRIAGDCWEGFGWPRRGGFAREF